MLIEKTFRGDFNKFLNKIIIGEPFAFTRFSDGELRILQNKKLICKKNEMWIGDHEVKNHIYQEEDYKVFEPDKHQFFREKLLESLQFKKKNYYKGISCKCCLSGKHGYTVEEEFNWQVELSGLDKYDEHLTWSNLFVNGNYPYFLEHMLPYFFNYNIIIICNEKYNIKTLPFYNKIVKNYRVGFNCMENNYHLIDDIKCYITDNNIKNHLFLFSAASLSNFLSHQLFEFNNENTYLDIGTTLHPFMGGRLDRGYLRAYWLNSGEPDINKICIW
jgi:hypothetical protein